MAVMASCSKESSDGAYERGEPWMNGEASYSDNVKNSKVTATVTLVPVEGRYYLRIDDKTLALVQNQEICSGSETRAIAEFVPVSTEQWTIG